MVRRLTAKPEALAARGIDVKATHGAGDAQREAQERHIHACNAITLLETVAFVLDRVYADQMLAAPHHHAAKATSDARDEIHRALEFAKLLRDATRRAL